MSNTISPQQYLEEVIEVARLVDFREVMKFVELLETAYRNRRSVFVIGNGGSAANASHFAQDLAKGSVPDLEKERLRVLSLTDNIAFIMALANDNGYDRVFDLQLRQFAERDDILVAISGSGSSANILKAVDYARETGVTVVGMTGFDGGELGKLADFKIHVPCYDICKCEAVQAVLFHMIVNLLKRKLA